MNLNLKELKERFIDNCENVFMFFFDFTPVVLATVFIIIIIGSLFVWLPSRSNDTMEQEQSNVYKPKYTTSGFVGEIQTKMNPLLEIRDELRGIKKELEKMNHDR